MILSGDLKRRQLPPSTHRQQMLCPSKLPSVKRRNSGAERPHPPRHELRNLFGCPDEKLALFAFAVGILRRVKPPLGSVISRWT
jgi:hypothetical protein